MSGAADHCKHGTYVGGCGIDWMCHACEMGDPDPTILDEQQHMAREVGHLLRIAFELLPKFWNGDLAAYLAQEHLRNIKSSAAFLAEIREWAESDTDDDWMRRRHDHFIQEEWEEEQANPPEPRTHYTEIDEIHEYGYVPS